jgi:hypothetical protein
MLRRSVVNRANPLLGKEVAKGAVDTMKQTRSAQQALKPPTSVNMSATQSAAANLSKPIQTPLTPKNVPVGSGSPTYNVKARATNPVGIPSNQPKTSLTGVSFAGAPQVAPQAKPDIMSAYKPTRSSMPAQTPSLRGTVPQTTYNPEMAQTLSKLAEIMKW